MEAELEAKEQQLRDRDEAIAALEEKVKATQLALAKEQSASSLVQLYADKVKALERKVGDLQDQLKESQQGKARAESLLEDLKKQSSDGDASSTTAELDASRRAVESLVAEKERLEVINGELKAKVEQLQSENQALATAKSGNAPDMSHLAMEELEKQLTAASEEKVSALLQETEKLKAKIKELSSEPASPRGSVSARRPPLVMPYLGQSNSSLSEDYDKSQPGTPSMHTAFPSSQSVAHTPRSGRSSGHSTPQLTSARLKGAFARTQSNAVGRVGGDEHVAALEERLKRVTMAAASAAEASRKHADAEAKLEAANRHIEDQKAVMSSLEEKIKGLAQQLKEAKLKRDRPRLLSALKKDKNSKTKDELQKEVEELKMELEELKQDYEDMVEKAEADELESAFKVSYALDERQAMEENMLRKVEESEREKKQALIQMKFLCAVKTEVARNLKKRISETSL